ncbi:hypothetical protein LTR91_023831 [Friedmanniomyces endolithicus]|uniref:Uncharacterized protein n=2 Tax=Dothideomycetidae TaxID=451867 RepID=A0AAN6H2Z0_9PEZI|nr:hypothetical protein LTR94_006372 [Friedmanniomyces endolithicus]KAK5143216.1 hypothetical protein LTR32_004611 [Rachicladosporium monterosium]KAK0771779.1 hypothetical protein LTR38_017106 [Friedmanniomyces endolithicus]KAK0801169.1 hypothetical protein LTR59_005461 [Friedmanniomyces endolithicus]KAK0829688.1 hypothetical protein LTR03_016080 [Friedmanniomyces endolithicus]
MIAIAYPAVRSHLRDCHKDLTPEQRSIFVTEAHKLAKLARSKEDVVYPRPSDPPVEEFPLHQDGLRCDSFQPNGQLCGYICRTRRSIQEHCKGEHGWKNQQKRGGHAALKQVHTSKKLWTTDISCETFFRQHGWQHYFQVTVPASFLEPSQRHEAIRSFFASQHEDIDVTRQDTVDAANYVECFDRHHSTVVPWLQPTGIASHVHGLRNDQIRSAVAPPDADKEPVLQVLVDAMQEVLKTAHGWCFDGPDCTLNWPSRIALSQFQGPHSEATRKMRVFASHKRPASLKK